jgi:type VI secretion system secreted protein VgrG
MATWNRSKALLTMTSALPADTLIPVSLSAHEALSTPFQFNVEVVCQQDSADPNKLLNQPACVTLQADGAPIRYFHGIVQTVVSGSPVRGQSGAASYRVFHLTLVPRLWFMSQTLDCRVYEGKSAAVILKAMFGDIGLTDLSGPPSAASRGYTVQFNESDLHFATRLMEEEGWFYFFQHTASAHTLVIAKDNAAFKAIPKGTLSAGGANNAGHTPVEDFHRSTATVHGHWMLKDYDPENPATLLKNAQPTTLKAAGAPARDAFRWPALTFDNGVVGDRTNWEMQAAEAAASVCEGTTHFGGLVPGATFVLSSRPAGTLDGTYAVRGTNHHARDETWINQSAPQTYACHFTCFLNSVPWRQPMATRRPRMEGIHTALVMGPQSTAAADIKMQSGEEIHTDNLGRVRVRFFWDHRGDATGGGAVWARVVQPWGGNGWGAQFIPRVGTEVAVGFVDGDPDRPMVLGGLYNGISDVLYKVSDKTKLGFRSRSTPNGTPTNVSEFTIDDRAGEELIYFHAEKDYTTEVEHDQTLTVDNCRVVTVKKDETVDIQGKQTITVKGHRTIRVSQGNLSTTVDKGNSTLDVSLGNISVKAGAGKIELEAMQSITLTVGSNSIKIDQTGIVLDGMMVKISGQTMAQMSSPLTTVKADGMLTLKGGITMIN